MSISLIYTFDDDEFDLKNKIVNTDGYYKQLHIEHKKGTKYSTSHYCGVAKLQLINDDDKEAEKAVLIVSPRFGITWDTVLSMLSFIESVFFDNKADEADKADFLKFCEKCFYPTIHTIERRISDLACNNDEIVYDEVTEFAFDIALLYEFYCRAEIKKALPPEWKLAPYEEKKSVFAEEAQNKKLYLGGNLIPDIIIRNIRNESKDTTVILDAKFKDGSSGQSRRDDRLQILAYQYMYNATVIGHILPRCSNTSTQINSPLKDKICDYVQLKLHPNPNDVESFRSKLKEVLAQAIAIKDKKNDNNQ